MTPPSPLPWKWDKLANGACRVFIGDQPIVVENGPDAELIVKSVNIFPKLVDALEKTLHKWSPELANEIEKLLHEARGEK